ncbi:MAG: toxin-antitoxin system, antitoxin component, Xre family protein [Leptolyngbya sp.]|nr:MAG: toxin-antitoxin system, antitoxin component, Xre family protein [Leptolyngbya sp.]
MVNAISQQALVEKILKLPPDKVLEVEDFVDFLLNRAQDRQLVTAATALSVAVFQTVWDNPDDAEYDHL